MNNIKLIDIQGIKSFLMSINEPKYRAIQIFEWLWQKNVSNFSEMKNIPKNLQQKLSQEFSIPAIKIVHSVVSKIDNSSKYIFSTADNLLVEGVLIPTTTEKRITACISTQVGCPLSCTFCSTGTLGLKRNLTSSEIYEQVFLLNQRSLHIYGKKLTNIVVMGMGEPLLNYNNLMRAIDFLTSSKGLQISPARITVSTVGLTKQLQKLANDKPKFNLAVSLHSAVDEKRSKIMPINEQNSIPELIKVLKYYHKKTQKRITFEYLMIAKITDTKSDADALTKFCKNFPCKINLIPYNNVSHIDYHKSSQKNTSKFQEYLESKNLIVTVRHSKGQDIDAACGQLVLKKTKSKKHKFS